MAERWQLHWRNTLYQIDGRIKVPGTFDTDQLILKIVEKRLYRAAKFAAFMTQFWQVPGFGLVRAESVALRDDFQLIALETTYPYSLEIETSTSIQELEITLWRSILPVTNPSVVNVNFPSSTSTVSSTVVSKITSQVLVAANPQRKGATIYNASTSILFLDYDADDTTTDYAVQVQPGGYVELPYGFTGNVSGIWQTANGNAYVREFV